jgi:hypothetical protein
MTATIAAHASLVTVGAAAYAMLAGAWVLDRIRTGRRNARRARTAQLLSIGAAARRAQA